MAAARPALLLRAFVAARAIFPSVWQGQEAAWLPSQQATLDPVERAGADAVAEWAAEARATSERLTAVLRQAGALVSDGHVAAALQLLPRASDDAAWAALARRRGAIAAEHCLSTSELPSLSELKERIDAERRTLVVALLAASRQSADSRVGAAELASLVAAAVPRGEVQTLVRHAPSLNDALFCFASSLAVEAPLSLRAACASFAKFALGEPTEGGGESGASLPAFTGRVHLEWIARGVSPAASSSLYHSHRVRQPSSRSSIRAMRRTSSESDMHSDPGRHDVRAAPRSRRKLPQLPAREEHRWRLWERALATCLLWRLAMSPRADPRGAARAEAVLGEGRLGVERVSRAEFTAEGALARAQGNIELAVAAESFRLPRGSDERPIVASFECVAAWNEFAALCSAARPAPLVTAASSAAIRALLAALEAASWRLQGTEAEDGRDVSAKIGFACASGLLRRGISELRESLRAATREEELEAEDEVAEEQEQKQEQEAGKEQEEAEEAQGTANAPRVDEARRANGDHRKGASQPRPSADWKTRWVALASLGSAAALAEAPGAAKRQRRHRRLRRQGHGWGGVVSELDAAAEALELLQARVVEATLCALDAHLSPRGGVWENALPRNALLLRGSREELSALPAPAPWARVVLDDVLQPLSAACASVPGAAGLALHRRAVDVVVAALLDRLLDSGGRINAQGLWLLRREIDTLGAWMRRRGLEPEPAALRRARAVCALLACVEAGEAVPPPLRLQLSDWARWSKTFSFMHARAWS